MKRLIALLLTVAVLAALGATTLTPAPARADETSFHVVVQLVSARLITVAGIGSVRIMAGTPGLLTGNPSTSGNLNVQWCIGFLNSDGTQIASSNLVENIGNTAVTFYGIKPYLTDDGSIDNQKARYCNAGKFPGQYYSPTQGF